MSQRRSVIVASSSVGQGGRDRVRELELLVQQPRVGLDVARLVHHLGRRVELGLVGRHGLHDLGGRDERALLAVHELRERVGLQVAADVDPVLLGRGCSRVGAVDRDGAGPTCPSGCPGPRPATSRAASAASHCCFLPLAYRRSRSSLPSSYSQVNAVVVWPSTFHWVCSTGNRYRNVLDMASSASRNEWSFSGGRIALNGRSGNPSPSPHVHRHVLGDLGRALVAGDLGADRIGRPEAEADAEHHHRPDQGEPRERHVRQPGRLPEGRVQPEPGRRPGSGS